MVVTDVADQVITLSITDTKLYVSCNFMDSRECRTAWTIKIWLWKNN